MSEDDFEIFRTNRHYIIKRKNGEYHQHSHTQTRDGCEKLLRLIVKGLLPKDDYFKQAAKRILTEEEYNSLKVKERQRYFNHNPKNYGRRV